MRLFIAALFLFLLSLSLFPLSPQLEFIRTIGDDEHDDYMFFILSGAAMSTSKDIFTIDAKGCFLAKYDWQGKFIKRVGTKGKGPGDFEKPRSIEIYNNTIYIMDFFNSRIAQYDLDLNLKGYIKILGFKRKNGPPPYSVSEFMVLGENRFLGTVPYKNPEHPRCYIFDNNLNIETEFFNGIPDIYRGFRPHILTIMPIGISHKAKRLMMTFGASPNPIEFSIFDFNGKLVKRFSYGLAPDLKSFYYVLKEPKDSRKKLSAFFIGSIHAFQNYFLVFIEEKRDFCNAEINVDSAQHFCHIFSKDGQFLCKFHLKEKMNVHSITTEGYVLATKIGVDYPTLSIYQLTMN